LTLGLWRLKAASGELPRLTRRILADLGHRHLSTDDGIDVWPGLHPTYA
jgi:hypothetical protein